MQYTLTALTLATMLLTGCNGTDAFEPDTSEGVECSDWFLKHRTILPAELPRRVLIASDLRSDFAEAIENGAASWNAEFEFDAFTIEHVSPIEAVSQKTCGWVSVDEKNIDPKGRRGWTLYNSCRARILIDPIQQNDKNGHELLSVVAKHELGHALGLPHIDDVEDIMYPYLTVAEQYDGVSANERCLIKTAFLNSGKTLEP